MTYAPWMAAPASNSNSRSGIPPSCSSTSSCLGTLERHVYRGHVVMMSGADTIYPDMAAASARARGLHLSAILTKPCRKQQVQDLLKKLTAAPL